MEYLVSDVSGVRFLLETQLEEQIGLGELPFLKMNKSGVGVCHFFLKNICKMGQRCPLRHIKGDRTVVCKHWLRGLCKKGDDCEFLHEYDMNKMPECYFFSKYGECQNKECPFLHIDPSSKVQDCPWYDRGFCRNGPQCKNRHMRQVVCINYINGFCLDGKECDHSHPKWWPLPGCDQQEQHKQRWVCHNCNERGHKIQFCLKLPVEKRQRLQEELQMKYANQNLVATNAAAASHSGTSPSFCGITSNSHNYEGHKFEKMSSKPLDEITCYKCGEKGHYANRCSKGYLAFLSKATSIKTGD